MSSQAITRSSITIVYNESHGAITWGEECLAAQANRFSLSEKFKSEDSEESVRYSNEKWLEWRLTHNLDPVLRKALEACKEQRAKREDNLEGFTISLEDSK
jgi:hypothetical protein